MWTRPNPTVWVSLNSYRVSALFYERKKSQRNDASINLFWIFELESLFLFLANGSEVIVCWSSAILPSDLKCIFKPWAQVHASLAANLKGACHNWKTSMDKINAPSEADSWCLMWLREVNLLGDKLLRDWNHVADTRRRNAAPSVTGFTERWVSVAPAVSLDSTLLSQQRTKSQTRTLKKQRRQVAEMWKASWRWSTSQKDECLGCCIDAWLRSAGVVSCADNCLPVVTAECFQWESQCFHTFQRLKIFAACCKLILSV